MAAMMATQTMTPTMTPFQKEPPSSSTSVSFSLLGYDCNLVGFSTFSSFFFSAFSSVFFSVSLGAGSSFLGF